MEFDEWNFSIMGAINEKWTNHEAESEDASSDAKAGMGGETKEIKKEGGKEDERKNDEVGTIDEEKEDVIAEMKAEIVSQKEQISSQQDVITAQGEQLEKLSEIVQKMQESQAAAAAMISNSENVAECAGDTNSRQLKMGQVEAIPVNYEAGQNIQEPQAVVAAPELERDTEEDLHE
mmetsp:Transcript_31205/g.52872  ORF Transcript_31205/g.52872 Transcript_31205/m.52872 type:complete len:177 (-) Transcript_31205:29-559(-)